MDQTVLHTTSPADAIGRLIDMHEGAVSRLRAALGRFMATRAMPTVADRALMTYPELGVHYDPAGPLPRTRRAFAKFSEPGDYASTITEPRAFADYLTEQLEPLVGDYGATLSVRPSGQLIPYPYVLDGKDVPVDGELQAADLARIFATPQLAAVGDEVADGLLALTPGRPRPLALFDAPRVDYSLHRLVHYTGTDWRDCQRWILFTNYYRYVDAFVRWSAEQLLADGRYIELVAAGGVRVSSADSLSPDAASACVANAAWQRHQMPAYHLKARDGHGVTLINIGVGPSNAKTITDHLAVLRPHCWLMIGHCGGLRASQRIGDYVLAHAYLREDHILDEVVPPRIPIPALAEVQVALQAAAAEVTGERGADLKARLRTGTVVTEDDRNWELRWSQEQRMFNLSRAIAIDMESGTIAAQGYRFRVPYGTLLCVSDKPLHGEIKLPGGASAFYARAVSQHLAIGVAALERLQADMSSLHSRKLRSFDEPPFR